LKAFLVYFPEVKRDPYINAYPQMYPDNRPTLIVDADIGNVAALNRTAIKIEEIDVKDVLVNKGSE
jgi:hypothetical protein